MVAKQRNLDMKSSKNALPPSEEKEFVDEQIGADMQVGETRFVVSCKWLDLWTEYINSKLTNSSSDQLEPIDNSEVLSQGSQLAERLQETDFISITQKAWDFLVETYGMVNGQTPIACNVIESGTFFKTRKIELQQPEYLLSYYKGEQTTCEQKMEKCSYGMTIGELKIKMREMFNIVPRTATKLVTSYMSSRYEELDNDSYTLAQANIHARQRIVIVEKGKDGWPDLTILCKNTADVIVPPAPTSPDTKSDNSFQRSPPTKPPPSTPTSSTQVTGSLRNTFGTKEPALKHSVSTPSNLSREISSYVRSAEAPGLCGLTNLGNTCYMSSALQCLSNVPKLAEFFRSGSWKKDLNEGNSLGTSLGMRGKLAKEYSNLMDIIWNGKKANHEPRSLNNAVGEFYPQFIGFQQHDSQELMVSLLGGLHEDLNRSRDRTAAKADSVDKTSAQVEWDYFHKQNDSIIVNLFYCLLKLSVICPKCKNESSSFDPMNFLSLPIPITERMQTVHFVSSDPKALPIKCAVKVENEGSVGDLLETVSKIFGTSKERLVAADIRNKNIIDFTYSEGTHLNSLLYATDVFIFEMSNCEDYTQIILNFMLLDQNISWPVIYSVPKQATSDQLYQMFRKRCQRFIDQASEKMDLDAGKQRMETNLGQFKLDADAQMDEPMDISSSSDDRLFEILKSDHGPHKYEKIPDDGPITVYSRSYWRVDFNSQIFGTAFLTNNNRAVKEHESLYGKHHVAPVVTLADCVQLFAATGDLDEHDTWSCPACKMKEKVPKHYSIWQVPQYLVIQLKRYKSTANCQDKIETFVKYPVKDFDMSPWVVKEQKGQKCLYDLVAVNIHSGVLGAGHYTAYAKNQKLDKWYLFNDEMVSSCHESSVVTRDAYLLIYERK